MSIARHPLDTVLGTVTKVKLLRTLVPLTRAVSLREAARLSRVAPSGAARALEELSLAGVVDRVEGTGQFLFRMNLDHVLVQSALIPLFAAETGSLEALLQALRQRLRSWWKTYSHDIRSAEVFGSTARGEDRPDSDLDLLVVVGEECDETSVRERLLEWGPELRRRYGVRLSPIVMTVRELKDRVSGSDPLLQSIMEEGISVLKPRIRDVLRG